jgi:hypothetical protein
VVKKNMALEVIFLKQWFMEFFSLKKGSDIKSML